MGKKIKKRLKLKPVLKVVGSKAFIARLLKLTEGAISLWEKRTGYIPDTHTSKVKAAVKRRKDSIDKASDEVMK